MATTRKGGIAPLDQTPVPLYGAAGKDLGVGTAVAVHGKLRNASIYRAMGVRGRTLLAFAGVAGL